MHHEGIQEEDSQTQALLCIAFFVIAMHLFLAGLSWLDFAPVHPKQAPQKLVVKTISLEPKTPSKVHSKPILEPLPTFDEFLTPVQEEVIVEKTVEPLPEPIPEKLPEKIHEPLVQEVVKPKPAPPPPKPIAKKVTPKKTPPPPVAKQKPAPKKMTEKAKSQIAKVVKKPAEIDKKKQALLAKAQESIAKIQASRDKIGSSKASKRSELKVPQFRSTALIADAAVETMSSGEIGYRDELASRLQLTLKMPEVGQVKLKLTLNRQGKFVKLSVLAAESQANRKYIEVTLPSLNFPPFGNQFGNVEEYTFSITLNSDL